MAPPLVATGDMDIPSMTSTPPRLRGGDAESPRRGESPRRSPSPRSPPGYDKFVSRRARSPGPAHYTAPEYQFLAVRPPDGRTGYLRYPYQSAWALNRVERKPNSNPGGGDPGAYNTSPSLVKPTFNKEAAEHRSSFQVRAPARPRSAPARRERRGPGEYDYAHLYSCGRPEPGNTPQVVSPFKTLVPNSGGHVRKSFAPGVGDYDLYGTDPEKNVHAKSMVHPRHNISREGLSMCAPHHRATRTRRSDPPRGHRTRVLSAPLERVCIGCVCCCCCCRFAPSARASRTPHADEIAGRTSKKVGPGPTEPHTHTMRDAHTRVPSVCALRALRAVHSPCAITLTPHRIVRACLTCVEGGAGRARPLLRQARPRTHAHVHPHMYGMRTACAQVGPGAYDLSSAKGGSIEYRAKRPVSPRRPGFGSSSARTLTDYF